MTVEHSTADETKRFGQVKSLDHRSKESRMSEFGVIQTFLPVLPLRIG